MKEVIGRSDKEILIRLPSGDITKISPEDEELLSKFPWWRISSKHVRVAAPVYNNGKRLDVWLHKAIMDTPDGMDTDHINGDPLDNRRENLRVCTHAQNVTNKAKKKNAHLSDYKGVVYRPDRNKTYPWFAYVSKHRKQISVGYFSTERDAAMASDAVARVVHGHYAWLNFPEQP